MRNILSILFAVVGWIIPVQIVTAQQKSFSEADHLFNNEAYGTALPLLNAVLAADPQNSLARYKAGICYLHSRSQKNKAAALLQKAAEQSTSLRTHQPPGEKDAPPDVYYHLGTAYQVLYE